MSNTSHEAAEANQIKFTEEVQMMQDEHSKHPLDYVEVIPPDELSDREESQEAESEASSVVKRHPLDTVEVVPPDQLSDREESQEAASQTSSVAERNPLDVVEIVPPEILSDREGDDDDRSNIGEQYEPWTEEQDIFAWEWITISDGQITMEELRMRLSLQPSWPSRTVEAVSTRYEGIWLGPYGLRARLNRMTEHLASSLGNRNPIVADQSSKASK